MMKFITKPHNIFQRTLSMFSLYLGKFNTTTPQHTGHATMCDFSSWHSTRSLANEQP